MKKALIGAGGHAREVMSLINRSWPKTTPINCMFVEDEYYKIDTPFIFPLSKLNIEEYEVMVAIGDPIVRERIVRSLPKETKFFTYIDPTAIIDTSLTIGEGSYIGPNSIITTDVNIGEHVILNRGCHVGHDIIILNYLSMMPGSIISGGCRIHDRVYLGTNSAIKENIIICNDVTVGLNAGVVRHINEPGVYVGTPAKKIK
tara:strand:+ start:929 stop:1534 length:606 start_codon:yes stop_codon:yes gene_type:complete